MSGDKLYTAVQADYAIVLGLALENEEPTPDMLAKFSRSSHISKCLTLFPYIYGIRRSPKSQA